MRRVLLQDPQCEEWSAIVAEKIGLHFPRDRWEDLRRGATGAANELGFADVGRYMAEVRDAPPDSEIVRVLADYVTVGETYFFRDPLIFQALSERVLPDLIRRRRGREQRIRIWSAACSSGEEAYSLAMLLHQLVPQTEGWQISITATDISGRALQKAAAGIYSEWSFRNAPAGLKERYFVRTADNRYSINPEIRKLVKFAHLNLVSDPYPSLATGTNAIDVLFCRNVLMYFTREQARNVVGRLTRALAREGWLVVSPSEASASHFPELEPVNHPGAIFFRHPEPAPAGAPSLLAPPTRLPDTRITPGPPSHSDAAAVPPVPATPRAAAGPDPCAMALQARALADEGKLEDALAWIERWITVDRMNAAAHHLRAIVLIEQGRHDEARVSLQRALYLDAGLVLAHFALGGLARNEERNEEAGRHFANALLLLERYGPDDPLPEAEGLTAGRLTETIRTLLAAGVAS